MDSMEADRFFLIFLAFCAYNLYIENKIEKEIRKNRELLEEKMEQLKNLIEELREDREKIIKKKHRYKRKISEM